MTGNDFAKLCEGVAKSCTALAEQARLCETVSFSRKWLPETVAPMAELIVAIADSAELPAEGKFV